MGLMKINQILKKYKKLHEKHVDSWETAQNRIRAASYPWSFPNEEVYRKESYEYQCKGNKLFDEMIKELERYDIFPKTN